MGDQGYDAVGEDAGVGHLERLVVDAGGDEAVGAGRENFEEEVAAKVGEDALGNFDDGDAEAGGGVAVGTEESAAD